MVASLGFDFLLAKHAKANIFLSRGIVLIQGHEDPLIKESELQGTCRMVIGDNQVIIAGGESLVTATGINPHARQLIPEEVETKSNMSRRENKKLS